MSQSSLFCHHLRILSFGDIAHLKFLSLEQNNPFWCCQNLIPSPEIWSFIYLFSLSLNSARYHDCVQYLKSVTERNVRWWFCRTKTRLCILWRGMFCEMEPFHFISRKLSLFENGSYRCYYKTNFKTNSSQ